MKKALKAFNPDAEFIADISEGLSASTQKFISSKYLYDEAGSALFEKITDLPEYGVTRAETRLLTKYLPDMLSHMSHSLRIVELGSGSATKTRLLLEAQCKRSPTVYCPIEISRAALSASEIVLKDVPNLSLCCYQTDYLSGLALASAQRKSDEKLCVLFLGSTIGNFDYQQAIQFMSEIRRFLYKGDYLLLGADLIKPVDILLAAYDDAQKVTAAFNLNILKRLNTELDANFDLNTFEHCARFNIETNSIEMHLVSKIDQNITISKANLTISLKKDETIWTESSRKYQKKEMFEIGHQSHFKYVAQWEDTQWPFIETLFEAA